MSWMNNHWTLKNPSIFCSHKYYKYVLNISECGVMMPVVTLN